MVPQRRFGRTGLTIPAITFGGGFVGGYILRSDRAARFEQLDAAMAAGVDWIDTAALYGQGRSEEVIGEWLSARTGQPRPRLATKFRIDPKGGEVEGQIRASIAASFDRLGVERVEAIFLHNQIGGEVGAMESVALDDVLKPGGIADVMGGLRQDGLCDHLGFTALGDPAAVKAAVETGRFDIAQVYYNLLNPTAATPAPAGWNTTDFLQVLDVCQAQDMGVMGIRIFAAGRLATDARHGREGAITDNAEEAAETARAAAAYAALGAETGSRAQQALRFGLAQEALSTIVVGIGEDWHFAHAVEAVEMGPLSAEAMARLEAVRGSDAAFVG